MKKSLLLFILITSSFLGNAQDIIVRINGQKINCKVIDVDSSRVYFILDLNDIKTSLLKSEIREIQYGKSTPIKANTFPIKDEPKFDNSLTVGFLEGGGSLVGVDYEMLVSNSFGIQLGLGFVGCGLGLNLHFKPTIRSSFFSIQYWHQGFGKSYTQSLLGPNIVFRSNTWFTFQLGLGYALEKGPAWPKNKTQPPIMLTYAIGFYIPYKSKVLPPTY